MKKKFKPLLILLFATIAWTSQAMSLILDASQVTQPMVININTGGYSLRITSGYSYAVRRPINYTGRAFDEIFATNTANTITFDSLCTTTVIEPSTVVVFTELDQNTIECQFY